MEFGDDDPREIWVVQNGRNSPAISNRNVSPLSPQAEHQEESAESYTNNPSLRNDPLIPLDISRTLEASASITRMSPGHPIIETSFVGRSIFGERPYAGPNLYRRGNLYLLNIIIMLAYV